ncbi:MAG: hydantoinase/oxoprolinase family protein [Syntrophales bacterium]
MNKNNGMMILGIDVGGTHTDAVLIENFMIKKKSKVLTNEKDLLDSLWKVTNSILKEENPKMLKKVVLSTTISTNAIVQGKTDRVGMILVNGPGLPPSLLRINEDCHFISGYVNHRGIEITGIDRDSVSRIGEYFKGDGIDHCGIVGKFSTRNPCQEIDIEGIINAHVRHISLGHRISGHLNFTRRISTTFLNEAIREIYSNFLNQVSNLMHLRDISAPVYILKADGGTFDIIPSGEFPVQTILSGPAASIMGILSMVPGKEDAIALDIGGTTTDIAVFAEGVPLLEALGITISEHKTLIRGLRIKSLGVGGDSRIRCENGKTIIGPEREGPAAAFGGPSPTPTDAMIIIGLTSIGDKLRAKEAFLQIARDMHCSVEEAAKAIFEQTCGMIVSAVLAEIETINNKPVYTIHEILEGRKLKPTILYVVGGPARPMSSRLGELIGCPVHIPEHAEVANAIGAALARTTAEITIFADTEQGIVTVGEEGERIHISPGFTRKDAIKIGKEKLREKAIKMGARDEDLEMDVTEDQEFNIVRGFSTTGKNIRIKVQIKPGLVASLRNGV